MKSFQNKTAVITGAASGIGLALARELAGRGCNLALSDINPDTLAVAERELKAAGVKVTAAVLDVSDKAAFAKYAEKTAADFDAIHIVINNAGNAIAGTVEETPIEDYELTMGIHYWGVVYGTKFFLPHIRRAGEGHIVNLSSLAGLLGFPGMSAYCSAKFAIRGFTESLRQELAGSGIGVSCVHPGGVKTNIAKSGRINTGSGSGSVGSLVVPQDAELRHERFTQLAMTTAESAAQTIVNGMEKNKPRIIVGPDAMLMDVLQRFTPEGYGTVTTSAGSLLSRLAGG